MRRTWGSVRFRITLGVTVLFAVTLSLASVLFVARVQQSLVDDIYRQDSSTLEVYSRQLDGVAVPAVLDQPSNRPATQVQAVDDSGTVVGRTPGAATRPLDPRLPRPNQAAANPKPQLDANGNPLPGARPPVDANGNPLPGVRPPVDANNKPLPGARPPVDANGNPLPGARPPRPSTTIVADPNADAGGGGNGSQDLAVSAVPLSTSNGPVQLIAATPLDGVRQSVATLRQALVVTIPVLVALIAACAWFITGRALRPVAQITAQVEEITATTLHERVPEPRTHDEVNQLARTMNAMLGRLEDSATRQRQFVSDASHELRTPVATIRTELEVALLHPDDAEWEQVARNVLAEDERLERIVGDLLTLARFDEQPQLDTTAAPSLDLAALVATEAARARQLPVHVVAPDAVWVAGRTDELGRLVGHLLDNAARHALGAVQVSVTRRDDNGSGGTAVAVLRVDDDGAGVPVEQRATVFERFGRLEEGRSRDRGGAGLGLAVVRRITERHHGTVAVGDSPLGGACFEVVLPAIGA